MRLGKLLIVTVLTSTLAACAAADGDFETDFAAAKANVATLEGGAFDHRVRQRITTPDMIDGANKCITGSHADRPGYSGVMTFEDGGGYTVRFETDDEHTHCLVELHEGKELPEPPARPYLLPIEVGVPK
ncbi:MAG: hypothetical protein ACREO3_01160 [Arenimonas sp.]